MKARLVDGSVVELDKDCGCIHHEGPHWLHMNKLNAQMNDADAGPDAIAKAGRMAGALAEHFARAEATRLEKLGEYFRHYGIIELIEDEPFSQ